MVNDLNNDEYRKLISDAGNSKDGLVIVDFLKTELAKLNFDNIDETQSAELIGVDFKARKQVREYLKKVLIYLIGD